MHEDKTVLQIGYPLIAYNVNVRGLLPVLADGQTIEVDDTEYTVKTTSLSINSKDQDITMYVRLM